ncbi:MAG: hypothetical protein AAF065_09485 [Verrucomicrobiota bacterium]
MVEVGPIRPKPTKTFEVLEAYRSGGRTVVRIPEEIELLEPLEADNWEALQELRGLAAPPGQ